MGIVPTLKRAVFNDDAPALSPNRAALSENLRTIRDLQAKRQSVIARAAAARREIDAEASLRASIEATVGEIDQMRGDARYLNEDPPDTAALERRLAADQAAHARLAPRAREASHLRPRYETDMASIDAETKLLTAQTNRLLHAAIGEDLLADLAAEFKAKEEAFREVHRRAFVRAAAADKISLSQRYGVFSASGTYADLHVTRPAHAAYERDVDRMLPEAAQAVRVEDAKRLDRDADALIQELLNDEATG